jgi:hypothetical protein
VKNWIFDDPFHKEGPVVGARDDPTIRISNLFDEMSCRGSKVWKITTEDFRVIQVLEFLFFLFICFEKLCFG